MASVYLNKNISKEEELFITHNSEVYDELKIFKSKCDLVTIPFSIWYGGRDFVRRFTEPPHHCSGTTGVGLCPILTGKNSSDTRMSQRRRLK
ncbi:hypothetical protein TNCV_868551 [Trichonephila clavipes]|nr:hypothetical protein TNCV_868551 [Trichonephila clavipes]